MLAGRRHSALLVEDEPAGLHMNLAARGRFGHRSQRVPLSLAVHRLLRRRLGRNRRRHSRPHQRNLHRPGGRGLTRLLVVLELAALDAVHAAAIFAIQLDLHVVQQHVLPFFNCTTFEA